MARDYKKEYKNYDGTEKVKKKRAARNKARRMMERAGKVHKGDGKDVNHKDGNTKNNSPGNLEVQSKSANRSYPRTKSARKKNPKD